MQTFAFVSRKGGVGKSTLTRQFSALAGEGALLIDRDSQMTTTRWWNRRQAIPLDTPDLLSSEGLDLTKAVAALKAKPGQVFIDTRPAVEESEAEAVRVSDLAVVPVGPSSDDLEAVTETLRLIQRQKKTAVLIVNGAKNVARATEARAALGQYPFAVCPFHLTHRTVFSDAHLEGRAVGEMKGPAAAEAHAELVKVWTWIEEVARG